MPVATAGLTQPSNLSSTQRGAMFLSADLIELEPEQSWQGTWG